MANARHQFMEFVLDVLPVALPGLICAGDCIHHNGGPSSAQRRVFYFGVVVGPSFLLLSIGLHLDHTFVTFIFFPILPFLPLSPFIRVFLPISTHPNVERSEWSNVKFVKHLHVRGVAVPTNTRPQFLLTIKNAMEL
jgi:hypothetical protein